MNEQIYGCPQCGGSVETRGGDWFCAKCARCYPTRDGITDFRCARHDYYFNPVPRDAMAKLTSPATGQSWDERVRSFLDHTGGNPDWLDNLVTDGRYAWKLFLELPDGAKVLDLGCGLGNLTKNLAPSVAVAYAMDLTSERLEFARIRFSEFNRGDRIQMLAGGDGTFLPFSENALDAVFLSGVLEWIPDDDSLWNHGTKLARAWKMVRCQFGDTNPRRQQLTFLREVRRVLKPNGQLFVAIENRFNHEYFSGRPDHHSGLKFGSLLPRFLVNPYSMFVNRRPYRTYTHSMSGYRKLLSQAGFDDSAFIGLHPGYSKLAQLVPLGKRIPYWRAPVSTTLRGRLASLPGLSPAFGIVASSDPRPSLLDRLRRDVEKALALGENSLVVTRYIVSGKDKGVLSANVDETRIVIKLPFNGPAFSAEEANVRALEKLTHNYPLAPRHLVQGKLCGMPYFVEEAVDGISLAAAGADALDASTLASVERAIARLNPNLAAQEARPPTPDEAREEIETRLRRLARALDDDDATAEAVAVLDRRLRTIVGRRGIVHGDLSARNVFVHEGAVSGIIDWESSVPSALPALDAINFLDSVQRLRAPESTVGDTVMRIARGDWPHAIETAFLVRQCERCAVDPDQLPDLAALYWVRHLGDQLSFHLRHDTAAVKQRTEGFLDFVRRELGR